MTIRPERPADFPGVRNVNESAFGQPLEADLVERLRRGCGDCLSLVAEDQTIVGHILFSPVALETQDGPVTGMGLGPMAVLPGRQREGIGSALVERGVEMLRERGVPFIFVVGHPDYYPRFGFEPASAHGVRSQWEGIPDEAFMVLVLDDRALDGASGVVRYRPEFDELS